MLNVSRWNANIVAAVCALSLLLCIPTFFMSAETVKQFPWMAKLSLGLDLQGGAHMLYAMDQDEVRRAWLDTLREDVQRRLEEAKIDAGEPEIVGGSVQVSIPKAEQMDAASRALQQLIQQTGNVLTGTAGGDLDVQKGEGGTITVTPTEEGLQDRMSNALSAALETVRRRVDNMGVAETTVVREGRNRILVQVPGVQDTADLKKLIGDTAKLDFHQVHDMTAEQARKTRVPPGYAIFEGAKASKEAKEKGEKDEDDLVLRKTPTVRGDELTNAQPSFDRDTNKPVIHFNLSISGARKFGSFTSRNVGKRFAIVLDGKVISAPVIQEAIPSGSGQISGNFTLDSAKLLATQLRSGALPAKLKIQQESTVGPSLGSDSIEAGKRAVIAGFFGVAAFLILGYGLFGFFAIVALVVNLALIIVAMAYMGASLTLPGIAGIVLTMGMSVDANVLINERIRDERRAGKTLISALDSGFTRAYGTILDTNMTGLLAALILVAFGSGPVRGFGVTLAIGIVASAFTATTVTRYLVTGWLRWRRPTAIPI
jgi:preprotein translocase subunit SecD